MKFSGAHAKSYPVGVFVDVNIVSSVLIVNWVTSNLNAKGFIRKDSQFN